MTDEKWKSKNGHAISSDAIRFSRRIDAEKFSLAGYDDDDIRVSEHMWQARAEQKGGC